jgi:flagellar biosynthesis chaperone FliJ
MLTEEQANQLRLEQYALEDAEIRYNKVQQQLEKYNTLLNTIKDNYNSYTPEQKARISAKM